MQVLGGARLICSLFSGPNGSSDVILDGSCWLIATTLEGTFPPMPLVWIVIQSPMIPGASPVDCPSARYGTTHDSSGDSFLESGSQKYRYACWSAHV